MSLPPWYKIVTPREDLREGHPLDASEFAVHLDQVREGRAAEDYQEPARFFERTYLTQNLLGLAAQVVRRLSGIKVETSAVFNMATQFGGGKTHALTLLYHLANGGPGSAEWRSVSAILKKAGVDRMPQAAVAVFVGQQFDPRGGDDGTPHRRTPWGEIAFQLGGAQAYEVVAGFDAEGRAPGGDTIRKFLPADRPALILVDEMMNYVGRNRKSGLSDQFYHFLQNLSETARGMDHVVLAVSVPASELEMAAEDFANYERFKKMLDRVGKAVIMAVEDETSEIIRRRLFDWSGLPPEGRRTAAAYADWLLDHRYQMPNWFPVDHAIETFEATYPFHPMTLSVFERKWQTLPHFQRTRGILRLLALWVSQAYQDGYKGAHKDPLITLGTAPLDDPLFRAAVFEQLGSSELEAAVTTDIAGKRDAHAVRLDEEAVEALKRARLHRKAATVIFFESNGGVVAAQADATVPEIRLATAEPDLDIGNVETALEALTDACYFLEPRHNRYHFRLTPGLNKILADRRATIKASQVRECVRAEIQKVFKEGPRIERVYFPEKSNDVPDRAALTLVVMAPEYTAREAETLQLVDQITREHGTSGRTFKSALIWTVADDAGQLMDDARKLLAWEDIELEKAALGLDAAQQRELQESRRRADRDLRESVWRSYKKVLLLGKDNDWKEIDLGLVHSSAAENMATLILSRLRQDDEVTEGVSPYTLLRNWPAMTAWSTRALRDAFYASPQLPRLLDAEALRRTVADGVAQKLLAYVGPTGDDGKYYPIVFGETLLPGQVEFSDDMFVIQAEEARRQIEEPRLARLEVRPARVQLKPGESYNLAVQGFDQHDRPFVVEQVAWEVQGCRIDPAGKVVAEEQEGYYTVTARVEDISGTGEVIVARETIKPPPPPPPPPLAEGLVWEGQVPPQKWMNFYTRVLARFATQPDLKLRVRFEVKEGVSQQKADETRIALRELGLEEGGLQVVEAE
ncbi:MAG: ATP-binding protein [Chloroflexota bacterium]